MKIITLGLDGTGKRSFMHYIVPDQFDQITAIDAEFRVYQRNFLDYRVGVQIWRHYGEYRPLGKYYQGASAIFVFLDINNTKSLELLDKLIRTALDFFPTPIWVILAANKIDLERQVKSKHINKLMDKIQHPNLLAVKYFEMSIIKGIKVIDPIEFLIPRLMELELRCYNCLKINETVTLKYRYLFCDACYNDPNYDKAKAFYRINK